MNNSDLSVLLIEDSIEIGEWICKEIEASNGLNICGWLESGEDAVDFIKGIKPDLIILDLNLPGRKGVDILEEIRQHSKKPMIIVFTVNEQARRRVLELGANYFFDKATEDQEFIKTLRSLGTLNEKRIMI